jgi:hypothetical protein
MGIYDEVFRSLEDLEFFKKTTSNLKVVVVKVSEGKFIVYGEPKSSEEAKDLKCLLAGAKTLHGEKAFIFPD